ncbi:glycoside hydrolase family 16 protein [Piloderma croceum F 1598]|uniref:Glycoside hydrolase family 16 protein n=1 Tax=Piloderma croceum (strain F 1598) TaxID=765440 RepID=A0A0C3FEN4_PILCF|nr:glycoside hydrolase family 16 protein [Piloderma croceum F 1598]
MRTSVACFLSLVAPAIVNATQYHLLKDYSGQDFFDGWAYYGNFDNLTNGDAIFVNASVAASAMLAYVDPVTNHAIIKVDNTTVVPFNDKRNTVRITTEDSYGTGSLFVADMIHVPYGCSVWPAWWSQAPNWPTGGEIDMFEGVNQDTMNQMSLHTEPGCTQISPNQTSTLVSSTDCSFDSNNNQGCIVIDQSTSSYGAGFASGGGGQFVTELAEDGISMWFFPRSEVPNSIASNMSTVDTSTFGIPVANWPNGGCNINQFFQPQNLIIDITLCGDFAGNPTIFNQTCTGQCYQTFVLGPPSGYDTAYFEIQFVRVYSSGNTSSGNGSTTAPNSAKALSGPMWLWTLVAGMVLGSVF